MKEIDNVAKRRIDYTQEEIAQQLHMGKSTIGNRMKEIVDYYNLEEDTFNKEINLCHNMMRPCSISEIEQGRISVGDFLIRLLY